MLVLHFVRRTIRRKVAMVAQYTMFRIFFFTFWFFYTSILVVYTRMLPLCFIVSSLLYINIFFWFSILTAITIARLLLSLLVLFPFLSSIHFAVMLPILMLLVFCLLHDNSYNLKAHIADASTTISKSVCFESNIEPLVCIFGVFGAIRNITFWALDRLYAVYVYLVLSLFNFDFIVILLNFVLVIVYYCVHKPMIHIVKFIDFVFFLMCVETFQLQLGVFTVYRLLFSSTLPHN